MRAKKILVGNMPTELFRQSTNLDRDLGGLKDRPHIFPLTGYYICPEN